MKKVEKIVMMVICVVLCVSIPAWKASGQADDRGSKDHPLFTRMPNFYIDSYETKQFDEYKFKDQQGKPIPVEG